MHPDILTAELFSEIPAFQDQQAAYFHKSIAFQIRKRDLLYQ